MIAKEMINKCDDALLEYTTTSITMRNLSKKYKVSRSLISGYILGKGIDIYSKKSNVNNYLFEKIDTEEKAYWLGFLYADGAITTKNNSYRVELSLKESDLEHLNKFCTFLNTDRVPKYRKKQKAYRVMFGSKKMVEDLISKGCFERKSTILLFPNNDVVPENLIHHFIRGYFDGDGCVTIRQNKNGIYKDTSLLGTYEFLTELLKVLNLDEKMTLHKDIRHLNNTFYIRFKKEDGVYFLNFIYENATIYLDRKYSKYILPFHQEIDENISEQKR